MGGAHGAARPAGLSFHRCGLGGNRGERRVRHSCLLNQAQLKHNLATVQAQGAYVLGEDGRAVV
jgi:hypothetical protein